MSGWQLIWGSTSGRKRKRIEVHVDQVNDSLYTLYKPSGTPTMQIIFFHGLYLEDSLDTHLYTWESGDGSCIWPQTWLMEDFPGAHVLTVSYCECVRNATNMYAIGENLTQDLERGEIGQIPGCPVVLVGHSVGGLVIKQLCLHAHRRRHLIRKTSRERAKLKQFLDNVKGIFYYSTPHGGSPLVAKARSSDSPLFEYFKVLNTEASQMSYEFQLLCENRTKWLIHGVVESLPTNSALFRGVVVVPEASARQGERFAIVAADHFSICKPKSKKLKGFTALTYLLVTIQQSLLREDGLVVEPHPQNLQPLLFSSEDDTLVESLFSSEDDSVWLKSEGDPVTDEPQRHEEILDEESLEYPFWMGEDSPTAEPSQNSQQSPIRKDNLVVEPRPQNLHQFPKSEDSPVTESCHQNLQQLPISEDGPVVEPLPQNFQYLPSGMVDVSVQVNEIIGKLENNRIVGIVGMGGSGKTALASAVFNELNLKFEHSGFVPQTKMILGSTVTVKEVVLKYIHCHGKKVNERDWTTLRGKKLLIVLDDLSYRDVGILWDLAYTLSPESRFIVTCRDRELLDLDLDALYEVPLLNEKNAMALFMKYAFPNTAEPPVQFGSIAKKIVQKCGGLPLTVEVLGKYLRRKNDEEWEQALCQLNRASKVDHWDSLNGKVMLSIDALGETERQMFLDAATFFSGNENWTLREALAAWKEVYEMSSERLMWQNLVNKGLVYDVKPDDKIEMHQQLRDLGRKIASKPYNDSRCRVWDGTLALKLLRTADGLEGKEFHALRLAGGDSERIHIARSTLAKLKRVRYLEAKGPVIMDRVRDRDLLPTELVLLMCVGDHLFDPACQPHLTVLKMYDVEKFPHSFGGLSSLRYLQINGKLRDLPESFGMLSQLNHLEFNHCHNLHTLPNSFGQLQGLIRLAFNHCDELGFLPDSFGQLSSLDRLEFNHCNKLNCLPKSFGQLSSLNCLKFNHCDSLQILPDSFGNLFGLTDLRFLGCRRLQSLPNSFGELSSLNHLDLDDCGSLQSFPESFGQLPELQYLGITVGRHMDVERLLSSLGNIRSLRHLELSFQGFNTNIPDCIKSLPSLCSLILHVPRFPLPPWLDENDMADDQFEKLIFEVQDGHFSLIERTREVSGCLAGTKEILV